MVCGIAPAVQLTRTALRSTLATKAGSTGVLKWRTKRVLISLQVMISLAFFLIAAFAVRIALFEHARPSGVDVERLAAGSFNFRLPPWTDVTAREAIALGFDGHGREAQARQIHGWTVVAGCFPGDEGRRPRQRAGDPGPHAPALRLPRLRAF